jgi:hypothetical protein
MCLYSMIKKFLICINKLRVLYSHLTQHVMFKEALLKLFALSGSYFLQY